MQYILYCRELTACSVSGVREGVTSGRAALGSAVARPRPSQGTRGHSWGVSQEDSVQVWGVLGSQRICQLPKEAFCISWAWPHNPSAHSGSRTTTDDAPTTDAAPVLVFSWRFEAEAILGLWRPHISLCHCLALSPNPHLSPRLRNATRKVARGAESTVSWVIVQDYKGNFSRFSPSAACPEFSGMKMQIPGATQSLPKS